MIFMDVNMPIMDGFTASKAIWELEEKYSITRELIIILSANKYDTSSMNFVDLSLEKPINIR